MSKIKRNIHNHTIQARTTRISQFTANYDDSTGKLNGEMTLNMYYLENTGKEYVPPVFPNMSKGVMSIFGRSTSLETAP